MCESLAKAFSQFSQLKSLGRFSRAIFNIVFAWDPSKEPSYYPASFPVFSRTIYVFRKLCCDKEPSYAGCRLLYKYLLNLQTFLAVEMVNLAIEAAVTAIIAWTGFGVFM